LGYSGTSFIFLAIYGGGACLLIAVFSAGSSYFCSLSGAALYNFFVILLFGLSSTLKSTFSPSLFYPMISILFVSY